MRDEARSEIIGRIQARLGKNGSLAEAAEADLEWRRIAREYRRASNAPRADVLRQFVERLTDYGAVVWQVDSTALPNTVAQILGDTNNPLMVAATGFGRRFPSLQNIAITEDNQFTSRILNGFEGVIAGATLGIAETGTLVLQNVPGEGRRAASLIPDLLVCIILESDIVSTVSEAIQRLEHTSTLPTTFISGPSATADIEMTRIQGVHGPRFLHVILLKEASE